LYNAGQVAGGLTSLATAWGTPVNFAKGLGWAQKAAIGYDVAATGYGAYDATKRIKQGCASALDALNFLPAVGYGASRLRGAAHGLDDAARGLDVASDTIGDLDWLGRPISQRTQNILDAFDNSKQVPLETHNGTINVQILENLTSNTRVKDLGKLQAATGQEYILLRGPKGDRVLIRGDVNQNAIPEKYVNEGYKWSGHSHPYNNTPSSSDREALRAFGQDKSVIIDMQGRSAHFGQREDLSNWLP
jgi:hypothetical protein